MVLSVLRVRVLCVLVCSVCSCALCVRVLCVVMCVMRVRVHVTLRPVMTCVNLCCSSLSPSSLCRQSTGGEAGAAACAVGAGAEAAVVLQHPAAVPDGAVQGKGSQAPTRPQLPHAAHEADAPLPQRRASDGLGGWQRRQRWHVVPNSTSLPDFVVVNAYTL